MAALFSHYRNYTGPWPWKDFSPEEIACRHCGELHIDPESMDCLQHLRDLWGKAVIINSGHRCPTHNRAVGGKVGSRHLKIAFDCACPKAEQAAFIARARAVGFTGIGRYPTFVHLDLGPEREW